MFGIQIIATRLAANGEPRCAKNDSTTLNVSAPPSKDQFPMSGGTQLRLRRAGQRGMDATSG
jgi:hypothetical protein